MLSENLVSLEDWTMQQIIDVLNLAKEIDLDLWAARRATGIDLHLRRADGAPAARRRGSDASPPRRD